MKNLLLLVVLTFAACAAATPKDHYVRVVANDPDGKFSSEATGTIVEKGVLTCYHIYALGSITANGRIGFVVKYDKEKDLMLLRFAGIKGKKVRFSDATRGQRVSAYTNALGTDGWASEHVVAYTLPNLILIYPNAPYGASGGALFNEKGEIVGIIRGLSRGPDNMTVVGLAIPAEDVRAFLEDVK